MLSDLELRLSLLRHRRGRRFLGFLPMAALFLGAWLHQESWEVGDLGVSFLRGALLRFFLDHIRSYCQKLR